MESEEQAQRLLQLVLETLPVGVAVLDREGNVLSVNPASGRIWGGRTIRSADERYQKSIAYWHDTGKRLGIDEWASQRALKAGETSLNQLIEIDAFDGQRKIIRNSAAPIRTAQQGIVGAVVVNEDVTERVRALDELRESRRALIEAQALGHTGSWEHDLETGVIRSSDENHRIYFGDEPVKGRAMEDYAAAVHPDDRERVMKRHAKFVEQGGTEDIEFRLVWPDGSVHWISGRATVVRDAAGRPIRVHGTNADITERKRAEEELSRRARQQAALAQLGLTGLRGMGLQPLFEESASLLVGVLGVELGVVLERIGEKNATEIRAAAGPWAEEALRRATAPTAPGIAVPIIVKERFFGVIEVHTKVARRFSEDEVSFVWSVANLLATSIDRERANAELRDQRQQMQSLSWKLIEAQEAERLAVARELHDDFGQVLTALRLNLQRQQIDQEENVALVDGAIARLRDLALDLRPPQLEELGLESSLRWYVERETARAGLQLDLALAPLEEAPAPAVAITCFRVTQEALTNVIRHAQARGVEVELRRSDGHLELVVRDDGKGFDVTAARQHAARGGRQGLLGMQERAELAGGELRIDSAPGRGTSVHARLPLAAGRAP